MWKRPVLRRTTDEEGFTLLEVLVAIIVLAIGLLSAALLMSQNYQSSVRSRYMAEAAQLASEKLEDLGRYPQVDEHVTVPSGANTCGMSGSNCEGSLTQDLAPQSITVGSSTYTVNYYDSVFVSATNNSGANGTTANGSFQETYQTAGGSNPQYATLTFSPNGLIPTVTTSTTAPTQGETFDRRWVIEQNEPITGVRRVTVLVTSMDATISPTVTFQMSMVRQ